MNLIEKNNSNLTPANPKENEIYLVKLENEHQAQITIQFEQDSCHNISIENPDQNFSSFEEKKIENLRNYQDFDNLPMIKVQQTSEECNTLKIIVEENEGMVETVRGE